jgi:hypothetical protein
MTVDFYQIIYHEDQRKELYEFAKPVFSCGLTPYFENAWISGLVPISRADYISVCSWRLRRKRGDSTHYLGGFGKDILTLNKIEEAMPFDVAILTPHSPNHKPLVMAENWHGRAWTDAYNALKPFIKSKLGRVPEELKYAIYENHFIGRREIYQSYVGEFLLPAIKFIEESAEGAYMADSGYLQKKKDNEEIKRVQGLLNRSDWPILPFLLERLFSFYINDKQLKIINL